MTVQTKNNANVPAFLSDQDIDLQDLIEICGQETDLSDFPIATESEKNVLIYNGDDLRRALKDEKEEAALKAELCRALKEGPGVLAVKNGYPDTSIIDRSTSVFCDIIAEERSSGLGRGDHFGDNERIWNSFQKACYKDSDLFIDYYSNPILAVICQAWLGPYYQISAQVNNVKPGGQAQSAHRDYHLGFQNQDSVKRFPVHAQFMSQYLTLQGAVAHSDMPIESGPTMLLPYSHQYDAGYMAYARPEFRSFFEERRVQLSFQKGDMLFFSPALFHGAGTNETSSDRMANLLQVSSAFGRTMETIDKGAMVLATYSSLLKRVNAGTLSDRETRDTIAAIADGYSFPTNLDSDPPVGGNAPETGQQLLHRALLEKWPIERLKKEMDAYAERRRS